MAARGEPLAKRDVAAQFGAMAEAYATSAGHARGSDLDIVAEYLAAAGDELVLDVATGAGHTAAWVAPGVRFVVASDLAVPMATTARRVLAEQGVANAAVGVVDGEALPFADGVFDAVTCRIAPHHFLDLEAAVAEIARVLRAGGRFVLEDSVAPEAEALDAFVNGVERLRDHTHVRSRTVREWREMLAAVGLDVVREEIYRKRHDVADWMGRSGLDAAGQAAVLDAFRSAPPAAVAHFAIDFDGDRAVSFTDDKVVLRADKRP